MIFIIQNGRLGNQLFQYNFIKQLQKNKKENIFFIGFSSLKKILNTRNLFFINNYFLEILIKYRSSLVSFLIKIKLFNVIYEDINKKIVTISGFLKSITLVDGYFVDPKIVDKIFFYNFNINKNKKLSNFQNAYFVHIRRGDFLNWPNNKSNALINEQWFIDCMKKIKKINNKANFYLFSDEINKINNKKLLDKCIILNLGDIDSFKFMCNCVGGILSASTYSWWAAYFSRYIIYSKSGPYYAPNYWAGFNKKKFYPKNFKFSSFLKFIKVNTK